jgi:heme-degrading monooxygenase HmoA
MSSKDSHALRFGANMMCLRTNLSGFQYPKSKEFLMHMLLIEGNTKGKREEFLNVWSNQILPTLKKQSGFVDEILLFGDTENEAVGLSFWKTKEDAKRYQSEVFQQQVDKVQDAIEGAPSVRDFKVVASETFRIAVPKAA